MQTKTILITGATNGIGRQTALQLAKTGARLTIHGRDKLRSQQTVQWLQKESGNPHIFAITADLSSQNGVEFLAEEFLKKNSSLDTLINNAGAIFFQKEKNANNWEKTFALNHMNYFYLTHLLMPLLKKSAAQKGDVRIINTSSGAHKAVKRPINFSDIHLENSPYSGWIRYCETKLMNIYFTSALAALLQGQAISVNALHPGFVDTGFGDNNRGLWKALVVAGKKLIAINTAKGAATTIFLATAPAVKDISGRYFYKNRQAQTTDLAKDKQAAYDLWHLSLELLGLSKFNS